MMKCMKTPGGVMKAAGFIENEGSSGGGAANKILNPQIRSRGGGEGWAGGCLPLATNNPQQIYFLKVERELEEEEDFHSASK